MMGSVEDFTPHTREILPGVTLTVCPTDRFKVGVFSLFMPLPIDRAAAPERSLLFSVLRRGCRDYPSLSAINRRLDELYATPFRVINSTKGGYHCVGFGAELLENRYLPDDTDLCGEVLSLMGKILFSPCVDECGCLLKNYVQAEQKNTVDWLRSLKNHPASEAMREFCDVLYEKEPYGHLLCGREEEVTAITPEQLTALHRDLQTTAPICCFYTGGMDEELLIERLRCALAPYLDIPARRALFLPPVSTVPMPWEQPRRMDTLGETGQSHLILAFRSGVTLHSPDFYAMMLCQELLALSPISRLFVHVREAQGLCYTCSAEYHIERGDIIVTAGIAAENRERAEQAILAQIDALAKGEFTDAEWSAARTSLVGGYRQLHDSARAISRFYELRVLQNIAQTPGSCCEQFALVTRQEVMAAAAKLKLQLTYFKQGTGLAAQEDENEE